MIEFLLADPTVPTTKAGNAAAAIWAQYGITAVVCLLLTWLVIRTYRMLRREPIIFVVVVLLMLLAVGAITIGTK